MNCKKNGMYKLRAWSLPGSCMEKACNVDWPCISYRQIYSQTVRKYGCDLIVTWVWYGCDMGMIWVWHGCDGSEIWVYHGSNMGLTWVWHACDMGVNWMWHGCDKGWHGCDLVVKFVLFDNFYDFWFFFASNGFMNI